MFDELGEIGTAAIEELSLIKKEQEVLEDRLARMDEEKDQVHEAVYERVKEDYKARREALEDKARPLKDEARLEYGKLQALHDRLRNDLETTRLDKEELEFRHRLGEHDDETFQERIGVCEKQLEERQGELRETEELRQRFIDAFRSEEELQAPAQEQEGPLEGSSQDTSSSEDSGELEDLGTQPNAEALEPTVLNEGPSFEEGGSPGNVDAASTDPVRAVPPPLSSAGPPSESEATVLLKGPRLVIHRGDGMEDMRLGVDPVTIGRAMENDVRFLSTSVSRVHAQVSLGSEGYMVTDLKSGNGTLVNGEPLGGERRLSNGDMIQVGSEVLVFRDR